MTAAAPDTASRTAQADAAAQAAIDAALRLPVVARAVGHLNAGELRQAEPLIRAHLADQPDSALGLLMLGHLAERLSIYGEAERALRAALAIAPAFTDARLKLGEVLHLQARTDEAVAEYEDLLRRDPHNGDALAAMVRALTDSGDYAAALPFHERLIALSPDDPAAHVALAGTLKTIGEAQRAADTYRHAIALDPAQAEAWWGLSNLKLCQLDRGDIERMEALLADADRPMPIVYLSFALGKAYEDLGEYEPSFRHYAAGNATRRAQVGHDRADVERKVDQAIAFFDRDLFARRGGQGAPARDPIFIVGMPRSGSTLIEQILASHPQVEGTAELPLIPTTVRRLLADRWRDPNARYPQLIASLTANDLRRLGEEYLAGAAAHRKSARPLFTDKLPINWLHVGLIRLVLPNATIIDARREPIACCFANFKQHFARGQTFSCSLSDVAHQYRQYLRLMEHFDAVLPGQIVRVQHESLLVKPEQEIRRLLAALQLPFDDGCLRFHENRRPVRTPSAEQVRRPINRDAVDLWRQYEPWLGELKQELDKIHTADLQFRT